MTIWKAFKILKIISNGLQNSSSAAKNILGMKQKENQSKQSQSTFRVKDISQENAFPILDTDIHLNSKLYKNDNDLIHFSMKEQQLTKNTIDRKLFLSKYYFAECLTAGDSNLIKIQVRIKFY